jgi:hypothetical protein
MESVTALYVYILFGFLNGKREIFPWFKFYDTICILHVSNLIKTTRNKDKWLPNYQPHVYIR